jgi:hypothetical protein
MKNIFKLIFAGALAASIALSGYATTYVPVQILNPAGSTTGQAPCSTGPTSPPGWCSVNATTLSGNSIGTSGAAVPLLNGANTWSALQTYSSGITVSGGTLTGFPGRLLNIQVFTASGTYTATTGTNKVIVEVQAPSGGSGGTAARMPLQPAAQAAPTREFFSRPDSPARPLRLARLALQARLARMPVARAARPASGRLFHALAAPAEMAALHHLPLPCKVRRQPLSRRIALCPAGL